METGKKAVTAGEIRPTSRTGKGGFQKRGGMDVRLTGVAGVRYGNVRGMTICVG